MGSFPLSHAFIHSPDKLTEHLCDRRFAGQSGYQGERLSIRREGKTTSKCTESYDWGAARHDAYNVDSEATLPGFQS